MTVSVTAEPSCRDRLALVAFIVLSAATFGWAVVSATRLFGSVLVALIVVPSMFLPLLPPVSQLLTSAQVAERRHKSYNN